MKLKRFSVYDMDFSWITIKILFINIGQASFESSPQKLNNPCWVL